MSLWTLGMGISGSLFAAALVYWITEHNVVPALLIAGAGIVGFIVTVLFFKKPASSSPSPVTQNNKQEFNPQFNPTIEQHVHIGERNDKAERERTEQDRQDQLVSEHMKRRRLRNPSGVELVNDVALATNLSFHEADQTLARLVTKGYLYRDTIDAPGDFVYWYRGPDEPSRPPNTVKVYGPAEQNDHDTVSAALKLLKEPGLIALRHIRRHGTLTFGSPGGGIQPVLPPGLTLEKTLWVYRHCASEGILTQKNNLGMTEQTFAVSPKMEKALDEQLYS